MEVIGTAVNARCERNLPSYHFECQRFGIPALSDAAIWSQTEPIILYCRSENTFWKDIEEHLIIRATGRLFDALV